MNPQELYDAQAALGYVQGQTVHIETQVYQARYPDITYAQLIPVDTSAPEWVNAVEYRSSDKVGQAAFIGNAGNDMPFADVTRDKTQAPVYMAGIGYRYDLAEINQARMLGIPLDSDRAIAAKRAYEEFVQETAFRGQAVKGQKGLFNHTAPTAANAPNGAAASPLWVNKTAEEILADVNSGITGIQTDTKATAMADTIIMSINRLNYLGGKIMPYSTMTLLQWIKENNIYTATTGQPLTLRSSLGLDTAGSGGTQRMITYRRSPEVLKLHIPMPHRFLPVQGPFGLNFEVPGIFRLAGVDIRLPKEVRYLDGI